MHLRHIHHTPDMTRTCMHAHKHHIRYIHQIWCDSHMHVISYVQQMRSTHAYIRCITYIHTFDTIHTCIHQMHYIHTYIHTFDTILSCMHTYKHQAQHMHRYDTYTHVRCAASDACNITCIADAVHTCIHQMQYIHYIYVHQIRYIETCNNKHVQCHTFLAPSKGIRGFEFRGRQRLEITPPPMHLNPYILLHTFEPST